MKILASALDEMADFPFKDADKVRYEKSALFIRGTDSHYVPDDVLPVIGRFFPRFQLKDVKAGHWVISENPEGFRQGLVISCSSRPNTLANQGTAVVGFLEDQT